VLTGAALCLLALLALLAAWAAPAWAEDQGQTSLVDTFMAGDAAGVEAAVLVSHDGEVAVERYYGAADDVDAETTFEWGRVSDLLVWTAVFQLVEQGELSLDETVADHLPEGVELPEGYEKLDVADLMNHAAGLDVSMEGSLSSLPDGTESVVAAFSLFSVQAEFSPGAIVGYTPYDALLAAAVVEDVSGLPFVRYVYERILEPLGMDGTYLSVGGSATRLAESDNAPAALAALARGTSGPQSISSPSPATSTVLVCVGTASDLMKLANGLLGVDGWPAAFEDPATSEQLFSVSRVYPSLGVARIAHGLFAFPFTDGVVGVWGTSGEGYSASVYLDAATGSAYVSLVNQSGRADLVQGVVRVLVGRTETVSANAASPANGVWVGTYQDAGKPDHGPAKLATALSRITVTVSDAGVLTFDGLSSTGLGAGVYSVDTAIDQDVYRFHVSLARGNEFSRATTDFYAVPASTLLFEHSLLAVGAAGLAVCLVYAVATAVRFAAARLRRRRFVWQPVVAYLAVSTLLAGASGAYAAFQVADGLPPAGLKLLLWTELAYVAVAAAAGVWLAVTRWRGRRRTRPQNAAAVLVCLSTLAVALNLAYWEMLP
jgi:CubicO group peptidase (beta-lactamase class C family)